MTSFIVYDILNPSVFWKIWQRELLTSFLVGSGGLDPALLHDDRVRPRQGPPSGIFPNDKENLPGPLQKICSLNNVVDLFKVFNNVYNR